MSTAIRLIIFGFVIIALMQFPIIISALGKIYYLFTIFPGYGRFRELFQDKNEQTRILIKIPFTLLGICLIIMGVVLNFIGN